MDDLKMSLFIRQNILSDILSDIFFQSEHVLTWRTKDKAVYFVSNIITGTVSSWRLSGIIDKKFPNIGLER